MNKGILYNLKYITTITIISVLLFSLGIGTSYSYLDQLDDYKGLRSDIMKVHNQEYSDYQRNKIYKTTQEYKDIEKDFVKVKTIFDVAEEELEKQVQEQKLNLINKIESDNEVQVGISQIDRVISSLQKNGKYFVMEVPGEFVYIQEGQYLYVYPHRLKGNVDLVNKMKEIMNRYGNTATSQEIVNEPDTFRDQLVELFDNYEIEYKVINNHYIDAEVIMGKNNNVKQKQNMPFFIAKGFTTPELEEKVEETGLKNYIWAYVTDEDIEYSYYVKNVPGTEVFAKIWDKNYYLGRLTDNEKIYTSKFLSSNLDLYVYEVNKNSYEYFIFLFSFIMGIGLALYFLHNFIYNYKANFRKIPEEI